MTLFCYESREFPRISARFSLISAQKSPKLAILMLFDPLIIAAKLRVPPTVVGGLGKFLVDDVIFACKIEKKIMKF